MTSTIRDVAKRAGVGLGTVSRVINNSPLVSERTRQHVLNVIDELNFTPNPIARRLSLRKTLTIAVITPFFTRPAFVERLRGVENSLAESEYDLIIYNVETPERRDACFRDVPYSERVDGVLILSLNPRDAEVEKLVAAPVPIVLVDANHPSLTLLSRIIVDDVAGGHSAADHLIQLGHERLGFIGDLPDERFCFTSSLDRYQGFKDALDYAGIPINPDYIGLGKHGRYEARRMAHEILTLDRRPTGLFTASDTQAMGVLEAARDLGIRVPENLSVIGYDDIEIAEFLELTTIRQMLFESGELGVKILLNLLENPSNKPVCDIQPTELVVRNTTAEPNLNN
ncbi:MAG: LacI family DNA-binding transcriptional regulator [Anaerolineales bacterium]|nr:LacI family DNA-binding transcriptional regulator [Anaerolineales bacterium]